MSEAIAAPISRLLSDERLTQRAVGGDDRAFSAIFRRYHQSLYRFCLAIVGNPEDAQEVLQNTMIKVLRALPGEERKIELKPWLYRIAHNESIDLLRRRRETRQLDVEQIAPGYGLAEDAATRERLRRLIADLKELPERQREVLVMRELAGLEFEEIGSALDTSGAVARQTLYEARQSLRQMEEGREMSCATVTKALSDGDGRVTRRRDVRAHLRSCARCQGFREEIKSRQHDLAALAPLPALAAAGMLQGLVGGSQGAAAGGGLATTLGGGAAKTIGASAAAKGVATAAVVAAIGVTAADRSGVIHLGLPGEQTTKSATPTPGHSSGPAGPAGKSNSAKIGSGHSLSGESAGSKAGGKADGGTIAGGSGGGASTEAEADPAVDTGAHHGNAAAHAHEHPQPHEEVSAEVQGPQSEQAGGQDQEKQYPEAAAGGQEAAATHQPPREASGGKAAEHAATPTHPTHPETPASPSPAPPEEAPANPPAAAPEPPTPTQSQGTERASAAPAGSAAAGAKPEKAS
ncbi:MAG TPA: RNA polymerase sigma factor [Solirubrobacterales bacterium]|jgi:RNA polymerase sigma factor (sigma-70 family)|nr:RNA polymerase sigma factor [Solirubrobacterales bacterium]